MTKYCFVEADIDGEGKRWRLAIDAGKSLALADEDFSAPKSLFKKYGEKIVGPFTVEQLLDGVKPKRRARKSGES